MSGDCCNDDDLFDCIQEAADCIRSCVSDGFARYELHRVIVAWSGKTVGSGEVHVKESVKVSPGPISKKDMLEAVVIEVTDGGRVYSGSVQFELSNSIKESFMIPTIKRNEEFYFELVDKRDADAVRLRLFPVTGVKPSATGTAREVTMGVREDARRNDNTPAEKIKMFVPSA